MAWRVNITLPLTAIWTIRYDGPPGDLPSPITDLPDDTRAFTLTGLTNYVPYNVTLNAMLDGTSYLPGIGPVTISFGLKQGYRMSE